MSNFYYRGKVYKFNEILARFAKLKQTMPNIMATEAVNFFQDRFQEQGWRDKSLLKWDKRKKEDLGRAILVKSGSLLRSITVKQASFNQIVISNNMPYAIAHNEGFNGVVSVKAHNRKKTSKMRVKSSSLKTKRSKSSVQKVSAGTIEVAAHKRRMNLPQRQFMGNSEALNKILDEIIIEQIDKIF